jgi:hypothetical protein
MLLFIVESAVRVLRPLEDKKTIVGPPFNVEHGFDLKEGRKRQTVVSKRLAVLCKKCLKFLQSTCFCYGRHIGMLDEEVLAKLFTKSVPS